MTLFGFSLLLYKRKLIPAMIFNIACILPGLISGNMWNAFRFDVAIVTFYLGCATLGEYGPIYRYTLIMMMGIISMICWMHWLSGRGMFA